MERTKKSSKKLAAGLVLLVGDAVVTSGVSHYAFWVV